MLKVMLVDPDSKNRSVLKKHIHAAQLGFSVVKEAENGQQALEELNKTKIDLVIGDVKLPLLPGYQLFRKIAELYPDTKMILYANYTEYEHVQKALEQGLIDYMFKPVRPQELNRTLLHAKQVFEEIEKKREEQKRILIQYDERLPVFQDRFLISLVHGHFENEAEVLRSFEYFHISLAPGYTVMVLKVDYYDTLSLVMEEKEKQFLIFSLYYQVEAILKGFKNGIAFINRHDEITIILGKALSLEESTELAQEIRKAIKQETQTTVTIGIGRMQLRADAINVSYKQAKAALRHSFYMGKDAVIPIEYVEPNNHITYAYPLKKEELLVYQAVLGNYEKVRKLLEEIFDVLKSCASLPEKLLPKIALDILVSVHRYASEQGIQLDSLFGKHFSIREIAKKDNPQEAYLYMEDFLHKICLYINEVRKEQEDHMYTMAKRYIETFYFEEISIQKLARYVQSTPEYINKLFMERENSSLYQYAKKVRMQKTE